MTSTLSAKRLVISTIVAVISSGTVVANACAFPKIDNPSFNTQQIRLQERDIRDHELKQGEAK